MQRDQGCRLRAFGFRRSYALRSFPPAESMADYSWSFTHHLRNFTNEKIRALAARVLRAAKALLIYLKYLTADSNICISNLPGTFRYRPLPIRSEWPILPKTLPSGEIRPPQPSLSRWDCTGFCPSDLSLNPHTA